MTRDLAGVTFTPDEKGGTLTLTDGDWSHSVRLSPAPAPSDPGTVAALEALGHDLAAEDDPEGWDTAVDFLHRMRDER